MGKETATTRVNFYAGTHGNVAKEVLKAVMTGDAAGTEFDMGVVPAGVEITDLAVVNDALGASTNVDVGYRYIDSDNGTDNTNYFGNFATVSAGRNVSAVKPIRFESDVMIVATVLGGAGTGELLIIPEGITRGVR